MLAPVHAEGSQLELLNECHLIARNPEIWSISLAVPRRTNIVPVAMDMTENTFTQTEH